MIPLPPDDDERRVLAAEFHSRPSEPLTTPSSVSYIAVRVSAAERRRQGAHLAQLVGARALPSLENPGSHLSVDVADGVRLKWERHGEFSAYTLIAPALGGEDDGPVFGSAARRLPAGWIASIPGRSLAAVHGAVLAHDEWDAGDYPRPFFAGRPPVGSRVADGAARACSDFRIGSDGWTRMALVNDTLDPHETGRVMQRLFEIEAYRMLALLAYPHARAIMPRADAAEAELARLTSGIASPHVATADEERLLDDLTQLAAGVERDLAGSQFRFGASRAYSALVATRIGELREAPLPHMETVGGFLARRFVPAVETCAATERRLHHMADRIGQAGGLLTTRVGVAREHQNQELLASLEKRARVQLRLQQTVEGLSVMAITYYASGLIAYLAKAAKVAGVHVEPELVVGACLPVVFAAVWLSIRRIHRTVHDD